MHKLTLVKREDCKDAGYTYKTWSYAGWKIVENVTYEYCYIYQWHLPKATYEGSAINLTAAIDSINTMAEWNLSLIVQDLDKSL